MDASQAPELPYITPELTGIGGSIKQEPEHFIVEEIPLYQPQDRGRHIYLCLERRGMTTRELQKGLARVLGLPASEVGYAGLKDKQALVTQTFSVPAGAQGPEEVARRVAGELPVKVHWARLHANKLKRGHLLGNRFRILVSGVEDGALERGREIAAALARRGLPNFFGDQRFGNQGDNAEQGRQILHGRRRAQKWLRGLLLSAYQSHLFNLWLARRLADGLFQTLLAGDVAKKTDTGGLFTVEDPAREQPRLEAGEITYTGPIYGSKMRWAQEQAGEREQEVLAEQEVDQQMLKRARLKGSRRPARLVLEDIDLEAAPGGLWFGFSLPKGAYATTVLREFMK